MPEIRTLEPDDFKSLLKIEAECFTSGYSPYFIKMIPYLFANTAFIAMKGRSPQGYVVAAREQPNSRKAWILNVAVRPKYRHCGLGTRLTQRVLLALKQAGTQELLLTVAPENEFGIKIYQHLGFAASKELEGFFGPSEDRILMKKML